LETKINDWESAIADLFDCGIAENAEQIIRGLRGVKREEILDFFKAVFPAGEAESPYFEYFTNPLWRKFLLSVYYADIVSYEKREDQADFSRLSYIVNKFPGGFTVWWIRTRDRLYPAGYTGWYYAEEETFARIAESREISSRFFPPARSATPYLYLFNYSAAPVLRGSAYSKRLIKDFVSAVAVPPCKGLFCAAVSGDGGRIAERFGMNAGGRIKTPDGKDGGRIYTLCR
jgi:hypothetical protein